MAVSHHTPIIMMSNEIKSIMTAAVGHRNVLVSFEFPVVHLKVLPNLSQIFTDADKYQ